MIIMSLPKDHLEAVEGRVKGYNQSLLNHVRQYDL